jgi:hypothetical protein
MAHYRLYFLGADDRVSRALNLHCPDDDAAIMIVRQHTHLHAMELWSGSRKVLYFPVEGSSSR